MTEINDPFEFETNTNWLPVRSTTRGQRKTTAVEFPAREWRRRFTWRLIATDVAIIVTVCLSALFLAQESSRTLMFEALGVSLFWIVLLALYRTRSLQRIGVGAMEYKRVVDATAVAAGWTAILVVFTGSFQVRWMLVVVFPVGLAALLLARWLWRGWLNRQSMKSGHYLSRVVVVGQKTDIDYVTNRLAQHSGPAYKVVGVVFDEATVSGTNASYPQRAGLATLESVVAGTGADAVIVAGSLREGNQAIRNLGWRLEESRTQIILVSSLTNVAGPRIRMRPVEGLPLMHVDLPNFEGGHHVIKRGMDVVLSAVALIALSPVFVVLALIVKQDSTGQAFFSQQRVGRDGELFKMYKFRSMVVDAEAQLEELRELNEGHGHLFKMKEDPRITTSGRWLRKYSLDELPQLYNVFKGDMSLVGPRPPLASEVAQYEGPTQRRLYIKPGVTGLWQTRGRSELPMDESIRLDLYYVENWSVTGDLMIMWRTLKIMIKPEGAY
ncbi:polyprenyl glycosylphosphotransferase [Arthrobacter sp. MYb227]|uniref:sugar transferase n=1 Tax=Arthrobacter sp. MYb227 TaxID=1848601 RepID=UPI000CFB1CA8|nr:sugar transferase [Arthrobacter sp. MYb227]PQZ91077.1 polyprenyl glycosylphosphotransferase [Arthrobacter sp. MYb227]